MHRNQRGGVASAADGTKSKNRKMVLVSFIRWFLRKINVDDVGIVQSAS